MFKPRGPAGAWGWDYSHGLGRFPQLSFQGNFAYASSIAHRIAATVLDGVNLSPQARTPRKSHCHREPPPTSRYLGKGPPLWQKELERGRNGEQRRLWLQYHQFHSE